MKLAIIGTGYVGLVSGACFAEMGNEVICVDADVSKVEALEQGRIPIYEPGLEDYVKRNFRDHRLSFTTDLATAVQQSLVCFIAVGTPQDQDGSADLSMVLEVAKDIGRHMNGYKVIVEKSTVPVGTAVQVRRVIREQLAARGEAFEFDVVSNPEFLKEGTALDDFMKPDRIVVGCDDVRVSELMKELYAPFVRTNAPVIIMNVVSAELTKYAANAFLATKISFINEIANICSRTGADINMVRRGIGSDRRIGHLFLFPGLGYGGSCFPKDMQALIHTAKSRGYIPRVLEAAEAVNQDQRQHFFDLIAGYYQGDLQGRVFALWGLSFKPKTDDIREAPALTLIEKLLAAGARVQAHDPEAMPATKQALGNNPAVSFAASGYEALEGADALIICTEWSKFREPDFDRLKSRLKAPVIFDGRNLYKADKLANLGFQYFYIGQQADGH
jgi:UDPglucose 6-dehydrogenase